MKEVKLGDTGRHVSVLQALLYLEGGELEITGSFDEDTRDALCEYQARYGINESRGTATPVTWMKLLGV